MNLNKVFHNVLNSIVVISVHNFMDLTGIYFYSFNLILPHLCLVGYPLNFHLTCTHDKTIAKLVCIYTPALRLCKGPTGYCIKALFQVSTSPVIILPQVYLCEPGTRTHFGDGGQALRRE